ncbi:MAG TPA: hypothetical protein VN831_07100, partial [Bradyrhizobium sp.]|nr:hypothetical protein [Bradyrhizobium sp.]
MKCAAIVIIMMVGISASDETFVIDVNPGIGGSASPQTGSQRRRTRALGKRREANQTAAQEAPRHEAASRFTGFQNAGRGKSGCFAEAIPGRQDCTGAKAKSGAGSAAAGAARA